MKIKEMEDSSFSCWFVETKIKPFMSFGRQPIANNFLQKEDFEKNIFLIWKQPFVINVSLFS